MYNFSKCPEAGWILLVRVSCIVCPLIVLFKETFAPVTFHRVFVLHHGLGSLAGIAEVVVLACDCFCVINCVTRHFKDNVHILNCKVSTDCLSLI